MDALVSFSSLSNMWMNVLGAGDDGGGRALADGVAGQLQTILVAGFFLLFIGGLVFFVASLLIDSLRPKRWMSFIALLLAAGIAVLISSTSNASFMDTIGSKVKGGYDTLIGNSSGGGVQGK